MIVKIFRPAATFKAIVYNFDKIAKGQAVLMKASGFAALRQLKEVRPEDFRAYLEAQSALNRKVLLPQFHAMISAPDQTYEKDKLSRLAAQWLESMGYGKQPYLLIFHRDTDQAHIHMVSTRVTREGTKIDSAFEHRRAVAELNKLLQMDESHQAQLDAGKAMQYHYSTKAQFLLLLEGMGYRVHENNGRILLHKFGRTQYAVDEKKVQEHVAAFSPDARRAAQLKAIFHKYKEGYDCTPVRGRQNLAGGRSTQNGPFRSDLGDFLKEKLGIELVFHASGDKPPYGYTVIDHPQHRVFKGSEVMRLAELITPGIAVHSNRSLQEINDAPERYPETNSPSFQLRPYLTDDIDDQQIHGPRRRRQKKARTNTR